MPFRPVRTALHLAAVTALAGAAILATGAPGHADAADRPESYGGDATASAFHYVADRVPQPTPVTDAFHAEIPYATTSLDSAGGASASAASVYPGAGPLGVPALLCQFAGPLCTTPLGTGPRYPLMATASYPTTPDDRADTSTAFPAAGPIVLTPNDIQAHAKQDRVEASTTAAGVDLTGAVSATSAASHSLQRFEGNTLVVTAETIIKGIDLGDGQLHIDTLHSIATARVDGGKVTTASSSTTITGASAQGHEVTIDSTGIHAFGQGDGGAAQAGVNSALANLKAQGIDVRVLAPTKRVQDGTAAATSGGLLVTFAHDIDLPPSPIPPLPPSVPIGPPTYNGHYFGSITVGGAGVKAFATPPMNWDFPVFLPTGGEPPVTSAGQPGSLGNPSLPTLPTLPGTPGTTAPGTSAPTVAGPTYHQATTLLGFDLKDTRVRLLALILLGYPLLVLLTAPVRRTGRLRNAR